MNTSISVNQQSNQESNGQCPNCWGYSEWANQIRTTKKKLETGAVKEFYLRNGFIRKFMKKYL